MARLDKLPTKGATLYAIPMLIKNGKPDEVKEATRRVIQKLASYKGLIIQDGNNIPPGSPAENINAMMEAAEEFGRYD